MSITSPTAFEQNFIDAVTVFLESHDEEAGSEDAWITDANVLKTVMNAVGLLHAEIDKIDTMVDVTIGEGMAAGSDTLTNNVFSIVVLQSAIIGMYNILGVANKSNLKVQLPNLRFEQTDRIDQLRKAIEQQTDILRRAVLAYRNNIKGGYVLVAGTTTLTYVGD